MKLSWGWGAGTFATLVAYVVLGYWITVWTKSAQAEWAWGMGLTVLFVVMIGLFSNGRADGVLIDNRNRVSLSKLQALCWTIITLPGFAVIVAHHLGQTGDYLTLTDPNLLAAMGISAASYIATPAILSTKASQDPSSTSLSQTLTAMNGSGNTGSATNVGLLFARTDPKDASWKDIFIGEEVGNVTSPDLSKIQQVVITVVLLGAYGALVWRAFDGTTPLLDMPKLPQSLLWLMGISHAGYLAYKLVPHSTTDDNSDSGGSSDSGSGDPRQQAVG